MSTPAKDKMSEGNSSSADDGKTEESSNTVTKDEDDVAGGSLIQEEYLSSQSSSSTDKSDDNAVEMIRRYMAEKLGFSDSTSSKKKGKLLDELTLDGVAKYILSGSCKNIVVMAGAGISTSAGIPDFRSPGSGLYDNLSKYKLPHPQAIFELDFFVENPEPFYSLAKQLIPGSYKPTPTHYFIRLLHEKGLLLRIFTQNIDGLERIAGIPSEKIVEAHGTFHVSHCLSCHHEYSLDWIKDKVAADVIPKCESCQGLVKPDIIFFGENLPKRFGVLTHKDFPKADLLIIMGSSLVVQPFASLVDRVSSSCPRLLLNREKAGHRDRLMSLLGLGGGLELDPEKSVRDVVALGYCDELCHELADKLGWTEDYEQLMKNCASHEQFMSDKVSANQFLKEQMPKS